VPKFTSAKSSVRKVFAIAPPSNGTSLQNLVTLAKTFGVNGLVDTILDTVGCDACTDLETGSPIIAKLNDGPIAQPGIQYTILTSKYDELVTPVPSSSFVNEAGVRNLLIQDYCPHGELFFPPPSLPLFKNGFHSLIYSSYLHRPSRPHW
jgi:hypothetical protein